MRASRTLPKSQSQTLPHAGSQCLPACLLCLSLSLSLLSFSLSLPLYISCFYFSPSSSSLPRSLPPLLTLLVNNRIAVSNDPTSFIGSSTITALSSRATLNHDVNYQSLGCCAASRDRQLLQKMFGRYCFEQGGPKSLQQLREHVRAITMHTL